MLIVFFFFNDTATTEIYTLSLHDALPIFPGSQEFTQPGTSRSPFRPFHLGVSVKAGVLSAARSYTADRKSTRLNSSHSQISYAVFCLKKKIRYYNALEAAISTELLTTNVI